MVNVKHAVKTNKNSLTGHITGFLEYCEVEKGLSPNTVENYSRFLKKFSVWLNDNHLKNIKPGELNDKIVWDYRLYLSRAKGSRTGQNLKKTTQNYYLIALRALMEYFSIKDIKSLAPNKIRLPKLTDKDKAIKFLSLSQVEDLLSQPDTNTEAGLRDRAMLEILFSTGFRVSELVSLNVTQFSVPVIEKFLKDGKSFELSISGKGGRIRVVYFSPRALHWLAKYYNKRKDNEKPLFINYRSPAPRSREARLSVRSVDRIIAKYVKMAGLPISATPHSLRHSFATDLLNQGAGLRDVQELLGHKNISTTQIYTHVTNKKLREVHEKFHGAREISN
ncbi:MAG: tyrosine-type recombinase/integrase [Patescibacteria group bacterium]|jgi:site-specific recombinase XerD